MRDLNKRIDELKSLIEKSQIAIKENLEAINEKFILFILYFFKLGLIKL